MTILTSEYATEDALQDNKDHTSLYHTSVSFKVIVNIFSKK